MKFPDNVLSLPYSTKFETLEGLEFFRVLHDQQLRVCQLCLQSGYILSDCPEFSCFRCKKQRHYARECTDRNEEATERGETMEEGEKEDVEEDDTGKEEFFSEKETDKEEGRESEEEVEAIDREEKDSGEKSIMEETAAETQTPRGRSEVVEQRRDVEMEDSGGLLTCRVVNVFRRQLTDLLSEAIQCVLVP